jgi:hypothetical protein
MGWASSLFHSASSHPHVAHDSMGAQGKKGDGADVGLKAEYGRKMRCSFHLMISRLEREFALATAPCSPEPRRVLRVR